MAIGMQVPATLPWQAAFVWGYKQPIKKWLAKNDAMSFSIRSLAKTFKAHVIVSSDKTETLIDEHNVQWSFVNSVEEALFKIKAVKPMRFILLNGPPDWDAFFLKRYSHIPTGVYLHGDVNPTSAQSAADVIFCHHLYQAERIREQCKQFGNKLVVVAPHTVDFNKFRPMRLSIQTDVFYPARRDANKRIELLEAACEIAKLSLKLTDVEPCDHDEMQILYNSSLIVGMVSANEAGPRVTLEALACGVPVIACNDCAANVAYSNKFGGIILVDPTPECVAAAMYRVIDTSKAVTRRHALSARYAMIETGFNYEYMAHMLRKGIDLSIEQKLKRK